MTNQQLYLAVGVPMLFNTIVLLIVWQSIQANMNARFDAIDKRFDDMRDLWRS